jgi:ubiquinone/menaquinone biosynthesis C-methylase UbiE
MSLTERQSRELDYHKHHAQEHHDEFTEVKFDVLNLKERRWWNAYWEMYHLFRTADLSKSRVLVVGCGAGHDALYLAKLRASVYAFDLSPDLLELGRQNAMRYGLTIDFQQMPAEKLRYADDFFDMVLVVDILHHCEVEQALHELRRVSKPNATWVINEIYTHSVVQKIRDSTYAKRIYPFISRIIYSGRPYITEDERKLDEKDLRILKTFMVPSGIDFF